MFAIGMVYLRFAAKPQVMVASMYRIPKSFLKLLAGKTYYMFYP